LIPLSCWAKWWLWMKLVVMVWGFARVKCKTRIVGSISHPHRSRNANIAWYVAFVAATSNIHVATSTTTSPRIVLIPSSECSSVSCSSYWVLIGRVDGLVGLWWDKTTCSSYVPARGEKSEVGFLCSLERRCRTNQPTRLTTSWGAGTAEDGWPKSVKEGGVQHECERIKEWWGRGRYGRKSPVLCTTVSSPC